MFVIALVAGVFIGIYLQKNQPAWFAKASKFFED